MVHITIFITVFMCAPELIIKKVIKTCHLYLSIYVKKAENLITAHIVKQLHFLPNIIMWTLHLVFLPIFIFIDHIIKDNHSSLTVSLQLQDYHN